VTVERRREASDAPVRLGLIGAGRWGRAVIATTRRSTKASLHAVASRNPATTGVVGTSCRLYRDWRDLLDDPEIEGVILTVPTSAQPGIAEQVIRRRLPLLLEKPVASRVPEAEALIALAREVGTLVQVDHIDLFNPALMALLDNLSGPTEIVRMSGRWCNTGPYREDISGFWDYGAHALAVCLHIVGDDPRPAAARNVAASDPGELVECELRWASGAVATITAGNGADGKQRRFSIACRDRVLRYDDLAADKATIDDLPIAYEPASPLDVVVDRFAGAVAQKHRSCSDLDLGVRVVGLLAAFDGMLRA
jgi:predicted dehydrogenase